MLHAANDTRSADPRGIITRALAGRAHEPAEAVLLAWLLSLPDALDPALAARRVLSRVAAARPGPGGRRLVELLDETARWPRAKLERLRQRPPRTCRDRAR